MALYAIELNDAVIAGVGPDGLALSDPGYVPGYAAVVDGRVLFGADARQQSRLHPHGTTNRFWRDFSAQSLSHPLGRYSTSADLVHAHLEHLLTTFPSRPSEVLFAVPSYWSMAQLGLLLGLADELALPVRGLVASAVSATRCEYADPQLLHLDGSLHDVTITRLEQQGRVSLGDRQAVENSGVAHLERSCVGFIANQFLQATRFDPLHAARSEQFLYDNLSTWLSELGRQDEIGVAIEFGGNEFRTMIRRDELATSVIDAFEPVARQIRSSIGADEQVALQVSSRLAVFPGVIDALERLPQAAVFVLEPAAAALGALQRAGQFAPTQTGVGLTTSLAWDRVAARPVETTPHAERAREIIEPTHVLFDDRIYRLGAVVFNIGAELADGEYGLRTGPALTGVSRRHCSIRRGDNGIELVDHSRFGTQLNGHGINDAAILQVGDVISIGSPPVRLHLVREVDVEGNVHGA